MVLLGVGGATIASADVDPPNDDLVNALVAEPVPYTNSQATTAAGSEVGEVDGCSFGIESSVWYKFTASTTGNVVAATSFSNYDTELAVYSGPAAAGFGDLSVVGCNDDATAFASPSTSAVGFVAAAGTTYYFQVDGVAGASGTLLFGLDASSVGPVPTLTPCVPAVGSGPNPDPTGDSFGLGPSNHDIVLVECGSTSSDFFFKLNFTGSVDPLDLQTIRGLGGFIGFDLDQNPLAGITPLYDLNCPSGGSSAASGMGIEAEIDLFATLSFAGTSDAVAPLLFPGVTLASSGALAHMTFDTSSSVTFRIAHSDIGPDGHNFSVVVGSGAGPTDCGPGDNDAFPSGGHFVVASTVIEADFKLSSQTVAFPSQIDVDTNTQMTIDKTIHNNGPEGPLDVLITKVITLPADCTVNGLGPGGVHAATDVVLAVPLSVPTPYQEIDTIQCLQPSNHQIIVENCIEPNDAAIVDPNLANNCDTDVVNFQVLGEADGKIVSAQVLDPPSVVPIDTNVDVTVRMALHNNGSLDPASFDLTKSVIPPIGCTVTAPPLSTHDLAVSVAIVVDEVWTINCAPGGPYTINFGNTLTPANIHVDDPISVNNTATTDIIVTGGGPGDTDGDGVPDALETVCGSVLSDPSSIPERVDGAFSGRDDDGNDGVDEALPPGSSGFDCDGDGYAGSAEDHVYSYIGQMDGDQKTCQEYDTNFSTLDPNQTAATPSLRWPSDFSASASPLDSFNRINILDLVSFLLPIRYFGTDVGTNPGDVRWDLTPGSGIFSTDINIQDMTAMIAGSSGNPPMLGGAKAFNGPVCPWTP